MIFLIFELPLLFSSLDSFLIYGIKMSFVIMILLNTHCENHISSLIDLGLEF